jgi:tripeptide aminopeptidase
LRATQAERERLRADFVRLCEIASPSRRERAAADFVAAELGLEVSEDESASETGADAGNLYARIPGPDGAPTILFCAHLDTVPLTAPIEVEEAEGRFTNRFEAILGADNKAAVAAFMGVARRFAGGAPVGIEFLFTTCEELALAGAKAFDRGRLQADFGFVFDHASPIGELIVAAPSYFRVEAEFHGRAAHAGIRPEQGRSAIVAAANALERMELGRVDAETTANAGRIEGGTAANVVPERCRVELEARSLDPEKATRVVERMVDAVTDAASGAECDVETHVEEQFRAYRMPRSAPPVAAAAAALAELGIEPEYVTTGGGSDANVFNAEGLPCLNVANGTAHNHEPDEFVTIEALEGALDVALTLVECSGSR